MGIVDGKILSIPAIVDLENGAIAWGIDDQMSIY